MSAWIDTIKAMWESLFCVIWPFNSNIQIWILNWSYLLYIFPLQISQRAWACCLQFTDFNITGDQTCCFSHFFTSTICGVCIMQSYNLDLASRVTLTLQTDGSRVKKKKKSALYPKAKPHRDSVQYSSITALYHKYTKPAIMCSPSSHFI